jgi:hypothetical protein
MTGHRWQGDGLLSAVNKDHIPLNNNRNNNRRRGRGNRNQGGGNAANRIDSRARGNAPQLLDKYKKLAQDAQHHGDRVQAEYYLQFADHYFRVIADNKARQDEARAKRSEERGSNDGSDENAGDGEDRQRGNRRSRGRRDESNSAQEDQANEAKSRADGDEPAEKPKRRSTRRRAPAEDKDNHGDSAEIDVAVLPPAISAGGEPDAGDDAPEEKPKPAARRRASKNRDDDDTLSVAG